MTPNAGIDIVSVARITRLIDDRGRSFLERWFTAGEIEYCTNKARPSLHFAARLAAKESVLKALGSSWDGPLPWRSIEITNDEHGVPVVTLRGAVLESANRTGIADVRISLSHCEDYATAVAIACPTT